MKKNELGGAFGMYEKQERLWWRGLRERIHLEDLGVDGRIILK
jgi:hypothetical protein